MKVVLIHGKDADPSQKWYPWLIKELQNKDIEIISPVLPKPNEPVIDEWISEIDKASPDHDTILIGHSRGGVAILRWLEKSSDNFRIKKIILISTNSGLLKNMAIPSETNHGFYTKNGYDFEKIRKHCTDFVVIHSKDDQYVPFAQGEKNAEGLKAKFIVFEDRNHFGIKTTPEFPELLEEIMTKPG